MHLFFTPDLNSETYTLNEDESKHSIRVLRLSQGDTINLVDGKGGLYTAVITDANPKKCALQIVNHVPNFGKRPFYVHIAVAPTKNLDRMEWFVEKAVEIGIDEISFLCCDHSERKNLNTERLQKIAISAMKQSIKAYLPKLNELQPFASFVNQCDASATFIAHLEDHNRKSLVQATVSQKNCILIGPEGDFSGREIEMAYKQGIKPVTLGPSRLRTETAALVACHTANLLHEIQVALP
ncbi:16S rRNA (uracil(1498)-N(3))-methyltransferase [Adhaeribacter pallidiroseus]|uniref:Ribosomal RNA small subunit methyltransferase E n=1 Tax=Adhaeribacter pallidiroseus TaxID=2072847 RepID=A0A369QJ27_9BACT|nr:16S rRNA (uracil(1498)-N(3))-methyltransferase [Adhaeribacter pallidiroseus]RDC63257.1 16S rRNA (uracil(1498)-N(3))-methyltransferase [Adhaeribacter pallidiroseus]